MKKWILFLLMATVVLPLSGCLYSAPLEELYQLPQLPVEYTELQKQLDAIRNDNAEHTAPASGAHIQSVQLVDLDNDGSQEAVAFFRRSSDERPLKIYIFRETEGSYQQAALIEGVGNAFYSIQYTDMDGDGANEILVGWRVSPELQALSVYTLRDFQPTALITTNYVRFAVTDMDGDQRQELTVLRADGEGENVADFYGWDDRGGLSVQSTTKLSMTMAELQDITVGALTKGEPALFVTGVAEEIRSITDVLAYQEGRLVNLTVNPSTGVTTEIFRSVGLKPADIDEDGVTEVPMPALLPSEGEENQWKVYWRNYDRKGKTTEVCLTYHNTAEDWFLLIPEEWDNRIAVRNSGGGEEKITTFSYSRQEEYVDFLHLYTLTGSNRESRASRTGRFILQRQSGQVIYAAALAEEGRSWLYGMDEEELRTRFRVIPAEWNAGDM